jgi:hypothetical protein
MPASRSTPKDIQILGSGTRYQVVRADPTDMRDWLQKGPACSLLLQHHISHVGIMEAKPPFEVVRMDQSGTFMIAALKARAWCWRTASGSGSERGRRACSRRS